MGQKITSGHPILFDDYDNFVKVWGSLAWRYYKLHIFKLFARTISLINSSGTFYYRDRSDWLCIYHIFDDWTLYFSILALPGSNLPCSCPRTIPAVIRSRPAATNAFPWSRPVTACTYPAVPQYPTPLHQPCRWWQHVASGCPRTCSGIGGTDSRSPRHRYTWVTESTPLPWHDGTNGRGIV